MFLEQGGPRTEALMGGRWWDVSFIYLYLPIYIYIYIYLSRLCVYVSKCVAVCVCVWLLAWLMEVGRLCPEQRPSPFLWAKPHGADRLAAAFTCTRSKASKQLQEGRASMLLARALPSAGVGGLCPDAAPPKAIPPIIAHNVHIWSCFA